MIMVENISPAEWNAEDKWGRGESIAADNKFSFNRNLYAAAAVPSLALTHDQRAKVKTNVSNVNDLEMKRGEDICQ